MVSKIELFDVKGDKWFSVTEVDPSEDFTFVQTLPDGSQKDYLIYCQKSNNRTVISYLSKPVEDCLDERRNDCGVVKELRKGESFFLNVKPKQDGEIIPTRIIHE